MSCEVSYTDLLNYVNKHVFTCVCGKVLLQKHLKHHLHSPLHKVLLEYRQRDMVEKKQRTSEEERDYKLFLDLM